MELFIRLIRHSTHKTVRMQAMRGKTKSDTNQESLQMLFKRKSMCSTPSDEFQHRKCKQPLEMRHRLTNEIHPLNSIHTFMASHICTRTHACKERENDTSHSSVCRMSTTTTTTTMMIQWHAGFAVSVVRSLTQHFSTTTRTHGPMCLTLTFDSDMYSFSLVYFVCVLFAFLEMLLDLDCGMRCVWCFASKSKRNKQKYLMKYTLNAIHTVLQSNSFTCFFSFGWYYALAHFCHL